MSTRGIVAALPVDPATDPQAPSDYAIRAIINGLDQVAIEMERKWGVGRLRLLVSDLLRAKFDAQKDKLDAAIASNQEQYIRAQAEGMKRAWAALDKAASEAEHRPLSGDVWECVLPPETLPRCSTSTLSRLAVPSMPTSGVCTVCRPPPACSKWSW